MFLQSCQTTLGNICWAELKVCLHKERCGHSLTCTCFDVATLNTFSVQLCIPECLPGTLYWVSHIFVFCLTCMNTECQCTNFRINMQANRVNHSKMTIVPLTGA